MKDLFYQPMLLSSSVFFEQNALFSKCSQFHMLNTKSVNGFPEKYARVTDKELRKQSLADSIFVQ